MDYNEKSALELYNEEENEKKQKAGESKLKKEWSTVNKQVNEIAWTFYPWKGDVVPSDMVAARNSIIDLLYTLYMKVPGACDKFTMPLMKMFEIVDCVLEDGTIGKRFFYDPNHENNASFVTTLFCYSGFKNSKTSEEKQIKAIRDKLSYWNRTRPNEEKITMDEVAAESVKYGENESRNKTLREARTMYDELRHVPTENEEGKPSIQIKAKGSVEDEVLSGLINLGGALKELEAGFVMHTDTANDLKRILISRAIFTYDIIRKLRFDAAIDYDTIMENGDVLMDYMDVKYQSTGDVRDNLKLKEHIKRGYIEDYGFGEYAIKEPLEKIWHLAENEIIEDSKGKRITNNRNKTLSRYYGGTNIDKRLEAYDKIRKSFVDKLKKEIYE